MKKSLLFIVPVAFMLLASCSGGKTEAAVSDATTGNSSNLLEQVAADESYVVVNILNNIEYWNAAKWAWKKSGELFGVKTSFVGPMDGDTNAMVAAFESAIAKRPSGICVMGWDPGLNPTIEKAINSGIPVVTFNGDLPSSERLTFVGSSNYELGYVGATEYSKMIDGKGKVALLTLPGNPMFEERTAGFKDGFANFPGVEIVAVGDTQADTIVAVSAAKDILAKTPDLKGFICADSTGAMGASMAIKEMKLTGTIDVMGMDRNTDVLGMIKDGTITASVTQNDVSMMYWAMFSLISAKHVDMPLTTDNSAAGVKVAPSNIYTSVNVVTKENVDLFLQANELYAEAVN